MAPSPRWLTGGGHVHWPAERAAWPRGSRPRPHSPEPRPPWGRSLPLDSCRSPNTGETSGLTQTHNELSVTLSRFLKRAPRGADGRRRHRDRGDLYEAMPSAGFSHTSGKREGGALRGNAAARSTRRLCPRPGPRGCRPAMLHPVQLTCRSPGRWRRHAAVYRVCFI